MSELEHNLSHSRPSQLSVRIPPTVLGKEEDFCWPFFVRRRLWSLDSADKVAGCVRRRVNSSQWVPFFQPESRCSVLWLLLIVPSGWFSFLVSGFDIVWHCYTLAHRDSVTACMLGWFLLLFNACWKCLYVKYWCTDCHWFCVCMAITITTLFVWLFITLWFNFSFTILFCYCMCIHDRFGLVVRAVELFLVKYWCTGNNVHLCVFCLIIFIVVFSVRFNFLYYLYVSCLFSICDKKRVLVSVNLRLY